MINPTNRELYVIIERDEDGTMSEKYLSYKPVTVKEKQLMS